MWISSYHWKLGLALLCGTLDSCWRKAAQTGAIKGLNDHRAVKIPALHFPAIMAVIMACVPICLCQSGIWFQEILPPVGVGQCCSFIFIFFIHCSIGLLATLFIANFC